MKHRALIAANHDVELPTELVKDLERFYENNCTKLLPGDGWQTMPIGVTKRFEQGDLPSLINFNLLMDYYFGLCLKN